jgi:hypothetical protein
MSKEKLWRVLITTNPEILEEDRRLTPEAVRRFFDLSWNHAYEAGAHDMAARYSEIGSQAATKLAGSIGELLETLSPEQVSNEKKKKSPKE